MVRLYLTLGTSLLYLKNQFGHHHLNVSFIFLIFYNLFYKVNINYCTTVTVNEFLENIVFILSIAKHLSITLLGNSLFNSFCSEIQYEECKYMRNCLNNHLVWYNG